MEVGGWEFDNVTFSPMLTKQAWDEIHGSAFGIGRDPPIPKTPMEHGEKLYKP
jgi:hypothetical protein